MSLFSAFLLYILNLWFVSECLFNAALYKPAYMSSLYGYNWVAALATDGNNDTRIFNGHCACTNFDNPGWWMVDLRGLYTVEQIVLVNRGDDNFTSSRTKNFTFDVFETDPRLSPGFPLNPGQVCYKRVEPLGLGETFTKNCTTPILGRFVRFIRYTNDILNFCEVQVMASESHYVEDNFKLTINSRLSVTPLFTTYTASPVICTLTCLQHRDSDTCTAVNWVRTTKQCQMLMVYPRSIVSLTADINADFYMET